jgi:hypothetical protein
MEFQCTTATSYQRQLRVVPLLCLASCCSHLSCGWVVGPLCCCWGRTAYGIGVAFYSTTYLLVHYKAGEKHLQFYYARPSRGLRAAHGPPSRERGISGRRRDLRTAGRSTTVLESLSRLQSPATTPLHRIMYPEPKSQKPQKREKRGV